MVQIHKRTKKMTEFDEITFHKDQAKQLMTSGFELGLNAMQSAIMMEIIQCVEPKEAKRIKEHLKKNLERPTYEKKSVCQL